MECWVCGPSTLNPKPYGLYSDLGAGPHLTVSFILFPDCSLTLRFKSKQGLCFKCHDDNVGPCSVALNTTLPAYLTAAAAAIAAGSSSYQNNSLGPNTTTQTSYTQTYKARLGIIDSPHVSIVESFDRNQSFRNMAG